MISPARSQKGIAGADRALRRLLVLGVTVDPFSAEDAMATARLWSTTRSAGLSLGDRSCLALALRRRAVAITADPAWRDLDAGVHIDVVR